MSVEQRVEEYYEAQQEIEEEREYIVEQEEEEEQAEFDRWIVGDNVEHEEERFDDPQGIDIQNIGTVSVESGQENKGIGDKDAFWEEVEADEDSNCGAAINLPI